MLLLTHHSRRLTNKDVDLIFMQVVTVNALRKNKWKKIIPTFKEKYETLEGFANHNF